jgi:uncharacterized protein YecT (DUF1311 family)
MTSALTRFCTTCLLVLGSMRLAASPSTPDKEPPVRPSYDQCLSKAGGVTISVNNCIGEEFDFQDKRLNAAYKALRNSLTDAQRLELRDQERAWIAERDKSCAPPKDGGTADMLVANECQLSRTALRAKELEVRLSAAAPTP